MPKSVVVIHTADETFPFGDPIWLYFKISPDDLNLILASTKWEIDSDSFDANSPFSKSLGWWKPESLGDNIIKYRAVIDSDGHERVQEMWTNSEKNEVYYRVTFVY